MRSLSDFISTTDKSYDNKIIYIGHFNSYGWSVDSRWKNYPFWCEIAFLPQILITALLRVNILNILELKMIKNYTRNQGLEFYCDFRKWTFVLEFLSITFGWVLDSVISNLILDYNIVDSPISYDRKAIVVKAKK